MRGVEEKGVDVGRAGQRMSRCSLGGFSHLITQSSLLVGAERLPRTESGHLI